MKTHLIQCGQVLYLYMECLESQFQVNTIEYKRYLSMYAESYKERMWRERCATEAAKKPAPPKRVKKTED
jgi:hypothetical protein